jgi:hypothetical protein
MAEYTPQQVQAIRDAIAKGREAVQRLQRPDPLVFARAYVAHGGIQIPGVPADTTRAESVAKALLAILTQGDAATDDEHVLRELKRVQTEVRWVTLAESDKVVGFYLRLGPAAELEAACRQLLGEDHGLGSAVFPKTQVVVLPTACSDYEFVPVLEDEVEQ